MFRLKLKKNIEPQKLTVLCVICTFTTRWH